jgi:hypothetical protein
VPSGPAAVDATTCALSFTSATAAPASGFFDPSCTT